jgi:hypothetical protein
MTQYSANPQKKVEAPKRKKGELFYERGLNSPYFFFKIYGGGTVPEILKGGWMSSTDADKARARYSKKLGTYKNVASATAAA